MSTAPLGDLYVARHEAARQIMIPGGVGMGSAAHVTTTTTDVTWRVMRWNPSLKRYVVASEHATRRGAKASL